MKNIINLVKKDNDSLDYVISKFPDGQQQVTITGFEITMEAIPVEIKSRLNNFSDLELIICTVKSLRNLGVKEIHLYVPYFLGSRSDRQFEVKSNNYLKDVICPIINSLNFESVRVIDPHSYVLEGLLNNFKKWDNSDLVKWVFMNEPFCTISLQDIVLVSPDAGASHKIYKLAEKLDFKGDILTCSKERDNNGKLTKCIIPFFNTDHNNKDLIIIDDICDGGQTFINMAEIIKKGAFRGKLYLIITHGIFSKGFEELEQYFDGIYCTNSYKDIWDKSILCGYKSTRSVGDLVKQLNIF